MTDYNDAVMSKLPPDDRMRIGIVSQQAPLIVNVEGAPVNSPGVLNYSNFTVGDVVALLRQDQSWLVLGTVASSGLASMTGVAAFSGSPGADTTTSAGITNFGVNTDVPWVKRLNGTKVRIDFSVSIFASGAAAGAQFYLQILGSGVAPQVTQMFINTAGEHLTLAGGALVGAGVVPAGSYTIQPVWARYSGAGTLTSTAGDDWLTYFVAEVN